MRAFVGRVVLSDPRVQRWGMANAADGRTVRTELVSSHPIVRLLSGALLGSHAAVRALLSGTRRRVRHTRQRIRRRLRWGPPSWPPPDPLRKSHVRAGASIAWAARPQRRYPRGVEPLERTAS